MVPLPVKHCCNLSIMYVCSFCSIPVRTIFEGLGQGCLSVAMSDDARYVATLSAGVPQVSHLQRLAILPTCISLITHVYVLHVCMLCVCLLQVVCVWEWTIESNTPLCQTTLSTDFGQQVQHDSTQPWHVFIN